MNLTEYEAKYRVTYCAFAKWVKDRLTEAISDSPFATRLHAAQARAKTPESVKRKLMDRNLLDSDQIEEELKDLAGVRLIFYTNTDKIRFVRSQLIDDNLKVDLNKTRHHWPTPENKRLPYQAIHHTVTLKDGPLSPPAPVEFQGMR